MKCNTGFTKERETSQTCPFSKVNENQDRARAENLISARASKGGFYSNVHVTLYTEPGAKAYAYIESDNPELRGFVLQNWYEDQDHFRLVIYIEYGS